jgi:hypothetical protein
MAPTASRVVRRSRWRWDAWALIPGGPWFWVGKALTRRGAQRDLRAFLASVKRYA